MTCMKLPALVALLCVAAAACAQHTSQPGGTPTKASTPFVSSGLGRGVNFGNMLEAPNEGDWGLRVEERFFDKVVEAGLEHIRLPITWTTHASHDAPYTIDPVFMQRIDWCVDQALARRLKIIVNMHHYDELNADPLAERERALAMWSQIAAHMQDRPASVVFEVLNEPHGAFNDNPQLWNDYVAAAVAIIRQSNPTRAIMVGPVFWNGIGSLGAFDPPVDRHLIATVHFYDPFEFTHQGANWVDPSPPVGTPWTGEAFLIGRPWQNWSWGTSVMPVESGLQVEYQQGWAGLYLRRGQGLEGAQRIRFTVDAAMHFNIIAGTDDNEQAFNVQTTAGVHEYTVDLPANGPSIEKVIFQNATSDAAGPVVFSDVRLETADASEPVIVTQRQDIDRAMQIAAAWAAANHVPLELGEFGSFSAGAMADRARWTRAVRVSAERFGMSWAYWELAAGFGFYDPGANEWRQPLLDALVD